MHVVSLHDSLPTCRLRSSISERQQGDAVRVTAPAQGTRRPPRCRARTLRHRLCARLPLACPPGLARPSAARAGGRFPALSLALPRPVVRGLGAAARGRRGRSARAVAGGCDLRLSAPPARSALALFEDKDAVRGGDEPEALVPPKPPDPLQAALLVVVVAERRPALVEDDQLRAADVGEAEDAPS